MDNKVGILSIDATLRLLRDLLADATAREKQAHKEWDEAQWLGMDSYAIQRRFRVAQQDKDSLKRTISLLEQQRRQDDQA